jgi:hypothetical protein
MTLVFPSSPAVGDYYAPGSRVWRWTGTIWQIVQPVQFAKVGNYVETITPTPVGHQRLLNGAAPLVALLLGLSSLFAWGQAPTVSKVMVDVKMSDNTFEEQQLTPVADNVIGFDGAGALVVKAGGGGISDGSTLTTGLTFPTNGFKIQDGVGGVVTYLLDDETGSNRNVTWNFGGASPSISIQGDLTVSSAATISGTNTGDQTTITGNSGTTTAALGLKTATSTVGISTATAPSSGQVLTATSGTAANWQTPAATGVTSVTGTGTVNGLALTGTVTSTGNLTLGGTLSGVNLATQITGTLGIANGGTGATTLTANNVLLGNGTSALQTVAPGTTGNVLTSNGTTWTSTAPSTTNPAGSGSELQFRSSGSAFGAVTGSTVSGGAVTLADKLTITQGTANANVLQSTGYSLTGTNASSMIDLAGTWNTTGAPAAIKLDITDTASNGNSYLMHLTVGGADRFRLFKDGRFVCSTSVLGPVLNFTNYCGGGDSGQFILGGALDTRLHRDAATIWAMRNGANAHTLRLYDTYTSASDYHRLGMATVRISQTATAGATITLTGLIPDGAVVMGVTTKVTTALTGGVTGYQVGTAADADRWGVAATATIGTTTDNRDWTNGTIECFTAATDVILTANGASFSGTGVIYVSIQYMRGESD